MKKNKLDSKGNTLLQKPNGQIQMVDLKSQYLKIKDEVDGEIQEVLDSTRFIGGKKVDEFSSNLKEYLGTNHVIPCGNGTDALQIALMALGLEKGDEVIVPSFTYVATAEVICLLGLKPVMIDVEYGTFNINEELVLNAITPNTKAIIIVHLFGQCSEMEGILRLAKEKGIFTIEDNAQAIGSVYTSKEVSTKKAGTMATIGTTSFFPSKNLGCCGDGGAMFTNDDALAAKLKMIANHGQEKKYYHSVIGCNSRLDAMQAAILNVKLRYLDDYCREREKVANKYDANFADIDELILPERISTATHVFHQYTLKLTNGKRDDLIEHLEHQGVPSMIYYPVPLYKQKAFDAYTEVSSLSITERLCNEVFSLPIHSEMKEQVQDYIIQSVLDFFNE